MMTTNIWINRAAALFLLVAVYAIAYDNAKQQAGANAEEHLKQLVVHRRIGTGIDGQEVHVLANPKADKNENHAQSHGEDGSWNGHGAGTNADNL